jgi:hypothetical protein
MFSDEDLEKPAKFDMELFKPLKKEYPLLSTFEEPVFRQLKDHYRLVGKLVAHGGDIYPSTLVINGAIVRSLNTYRGALWALGNGNPHVLYDCLRSHCETLAFTHYCTLNPDYMAAATTGNRNHPQKELNIPNILTMIDKLEKLHTGIRRDYDNLCNLVHPNPSSLYASIQPLDEKERVVAITTRLPRMKDEKAALHLKILIIWTNWIFEEIVKLAQIFSHGSAKSES